MVGTLKTTVQTCLHDCIILQFTALNRGMLETTCKCSQLVIVIPMFSSVCHDDLRSSSLEATTYPGLLRCKILDEGSVEIHMAFLRGAKLTFTIRILDMPAHPHKKNTPHSECLKNQGWIMPLSRDLLPCASRSDAFASFRRMLEVNARALTT